LFAAIAEGEVFLFRHTEADEYDIRLCLLYQVNRGISFATIRCELHRRAEDRDFQSRVGLRKRLQQHVFLTRHAADDKDGHVFSTQPLHKETNKSAPVTRSGSGFADILLAQTTGMPSAKI
jgi:hypothetical protein